MEKIKIETNDKKKNKIYAESIFKSQINKHNKKKTLNLYLVTSNYFS